MGQGSKGLEPNDVGSELENVGRQLGKVEDTGDGRTRFTYYGQMPSSHCLTISVLNISDRMQNCSTS